MEKLSVSIFTNGRSFRAAPLEYLVLVTLSRYSVKDNSVSNNNMEFHEALPLIVSKQICLSFFSGACAHMLSARMRQAPLSDIPSVWHRMKMFCLVFFLYRTFKMGITSWEKLLSSGWKSYQTLFLLFFFTLTRALETACTYKK